MEKTHSKIETLEQYLDTLLPEQKKRFKEFSRLVKQWVPHVSIRISYQMPAFEQGGTILWFGAFKNHYGIFPKTRAIEFFRDELRSYKTSKGTIQIPSEQAFPEELLEKIVRFRLTELEKEGSKKTKKKNKGG